jgi:GH15 family glucan-1,4-alpha-glucosidase
MELEHKTLNLFQASVDVIRQGQHPSGAYVASPSFSQYGYSWLRDGAWIAHAMAVVGHHDSAREFHHWAIRTVLRFAGQVESLLKMIAQGQQPAEHDFLPTRFAVDGSLGNEDWPDFQLDGYGVWLWVLVHYCRDVDKDLWKVARPAVALLVRYLATFWHSPNYDCWEEFRDRVHTATLGSLYGGLKAVHDFDSSLVGVDLLSDIQLFVLNHGQAEYGGLGKFIPSVSDEPGKMVDASLLWVSVPFGLLDVTNPVFLATLSKIEQDLYVPDGGVYRYRDDTYFGGGEWLLLASWLGWVYVELDRMGDARKLRDWVAEQVTAEGYLPEQVDHHLLDARYFAGWVEKWGEPANPLLWSHAMYLILDSAITQKELGS